MSTQHTTVLSAPSAFPPQGTAAEKFRCLLEYAIRAPSQLNTQPWTFRIVGDDLEVWLDPGRSLHRIDPTGRGAHASCGALLAHLRIALRHFGFSDKVDLLPDLARPTLVARVRLVPGKPETPHERMLFDSIPRRRTNRGRLQPHRPPSSVMLVLTQSAEEEGARLDPMPEKALAAVAEMVAVVDRERWSDPAYRAEYSSQLRDVPDETHDGLVASDSELGVVAVYIGSHMVRHTDLGDEIAEWDRETVEASLELDVISTPGDSPWDWVMAGQALGRVLLTADAFGLSASFFNQPVEEPGCRARLRSLLSMKSFPQFILRIGFGKPRRATPRRGVDDVLR